MTLEKVDRLAFELADDTGLLVRLRRRPNGFNLNISEKPLLDALPTTIGSPTCALSERSLLGLMPMMDHNPQPVLELTTRLRLRNLGITRTLRCPVKTTAQRVDSIEFEYQLEGVATEQPLLRVDRATWCEPARAVGRQIWIVLAHPYRILLTVAKLDELAQISVVSDLHGTQSVSVVVKVNGPDDTRIRIGAVITSVETATREPVLHALPFPLGLDAVTTAVTTPSFFPPPGGRSSSLSWTRPQPLIVFPRDPTEPERFGYMRATDAGSLRYGPLLTDVLRRSELAVFHGSAPLDDFILPLFAYLKNLRPSRLSSLLAILWLSPSGAFLTSLANHLAAEPLVLGRHEAYLPPVCDNLLVPSDGLPFDQLWTIVADQVQRVSQLVNHGVIPTMTWEQVVTPVVIPREANLPLKVALLGAARIRSGRPCLIPGAAIPPSAATWPQMPIGKRYALCVEIAECVQTDLAIGHGSSGRLKEASTSDPNWREMHRVVKRGELPLERLILVSLGDDDAQGLLKSLPAILYGSAPPAPVLAFRVAPRLEAKIASALRDTQKASEVLAARIASGSEASHPKTWKAMARARERLHALLSSALPREYIEFLEHQRPAEIVAFTNLPIEWLDIGEIPLGCLTKISKVHVESQAGQLSALFDLVRAYNSLTDPDYGPAHEGFKVLCVAPHYQGADQVEINQIIEMTKATVQQKITEQIELKREIQFEIVDGSVDAGRMADRLRERWDLFFYVGHARDGRLQLSVGPPFDVSQIQRQAFEGTVAVLLGCTTEGVRDLAGSIANEIVALGARSVFSCPARVHAGVMQELVLNLTSYLISANMLFGDTLQVTRFALLFSYAWLHSSALGIEASGRQADLFDAIAGGRLVIVSPADIDYQKFHNGWDQFYTHVVDYLKRFNPACPTPSVEIARRASAVALNISFVGNLRDRLFIF